MVTLEQKTIHDACHIHSLCLCDRMVCIVLALLLKTDLTLDVWSFMAMPPLTFREKAKEECLFY
jgi:hypothetical protein